MEEVDLLQSTTGVDLARILCSIVQSLAVVETSALLAQNSLLWHLLVKRCQLDGIEILSGFTAVDKRFPFGALNRVEKTAAEAKDSGEGEDSHDGYDSNDDGDQDDDSDGEESDDNDDSDAEANSDEESDDDSDDDEDDDEDDDDEDDDDEDDGSDEDDEGGAQPPSKRKE